MSTVLNRSLVANLMGVLATFNQTLNSSLKFGGLDFYTTVSDGKNYYVINASSDDFIGDGTKAKVVVYLDNDDSSKRYEKVIFSEVFDCDELLKSNFGLGDFKKDLLDCRYTDDELKAGVKTNNGLTIQKCVDDNDLRYVLIKSDDGSFCFEIDHEPCFDVDYHHQLNTEIERLETIVQKKHSHVSYKNVIQEYPNQDEFYEMDIKQAKQSFCNILTDICNYALDDDYISNETLSNILRYSLLDGDCFQDTIDSVWYSFCNDNKNCKTKTEVLYSLWKLNSEISF